MPLHFPLRGSVIAILGCAFLSISVTARAQTAADHSAAIAAEFHATVGRLLASDDFTHGLDQWKTELEKGGEVTAKDGRLDIAVPAGATIWLKTPLEGSVLIEYEATAVKAGGDNDRVSDLNCFWMARDARNPADLFATHRTGAFAYYDQLTCYYVGLGGNTNTTTRFRRYIGEKGNRPILPEHDLTAPEFLLRPNVAQTITLVAFGNEIAYYRDGRRLFSYHDPEPYRSGWFALRTTWNHLVIRNLRIHSLVKASDPR